MYGQLSTDTSHIFADDLVSFAKSKDKLEAKLGEFKPFCDRNDLVFNLKKTKTMIFYKGSLCKEDKEEIIVCNKNIERVSEFKYL